MAQNLNNKLVVIDGIEYRLVMVEDTRNKVIVSMETPFGAIQSVHDRFIGDEVFPLREGDYEFEGEKFNVKYVSEDEVAENVGKPLSELTEEDEFQMLLAVLAKELDTEE